MIFRNVDCSAREYFDLESPALKNDVKITTDTKRQFMSKNFEAVIRALNARLNILEESSSNPTEDERTEIWNKRLYFYQSQIGQKLNISETTYFREVHGWVALEMAVKYLQAQCWDKALERLVVVAQRQPDIPACEAFNHLEQMARAGQLWEKANKILKSMGMLCNDPKIKPSKLSENIDSVTKAIKSAREIIETEALDIVFDEPIRSAMETLYQCLDIAKMKELLHKGKETLLAGQSANDIVMGQKYCRQAEQYCEQAKELAKKLPETEATQYIDAIEILSTEIETHKNNAEVINAIVNQAQNHLNSGEYDQTLKLLSDSTIRENSLIVPFIVAAEAGKVLQDTVKNKLKEIQQAFLKRDSLTGQKIEAEQLRSWHKKPFIDFPTRNRSKMLPGSQFFLSSTLIKDIEDVIENIDVALNARERAEQGLNTGNYHDTLDAIFELQRIFSLTEEEDEWQQKAKKLLENIECAKAKMGESDARRDKDKLQEIRNLLEGNVHKDAEQLRQKVSGILSILDEIDKTHPTSMYLVSLVLYTQQCKELIERIASLDYLSAPEKDDLTQYTQKNFVTYIKQVDIGVLDKGTPEEIKELDEQLRQIQRLVTWTDIPAIAKVTNAIVKFIDGKLMQDNSSLETIRYTLENWMMLRIQLLEPSSKTARAYVQNLITMVDKLIIATKTEGIESLSYLPPRMRQAKNVEMFFQQALTLPSTVPSEISPSLKHYLNTIKQIIAEWYEKLPEALFNEFREQIQSLKATPQSVADNISRYCNKKQPSASWAVQNLHWAFYIATQYNIETNPENEDIYISFAVETIEGLLYRWAKMILEDTDDLQDIQSRLIQVVQVLALAEYFPYPEKESRQVLSWVLKDTGKNKKIYEPILKEVTVQAPQAYFKE